MNNLNTITPSKTFRFFNLLVGLVSQLTVVIKLFVEYSVKNKISFFILSHLLTSISTGKILNIKIPRIYEKSFKRKLGNYATKGIAVCDDAN